MPVSDILCVDLCVCVHVYVYMYVCVVCMYVYIISGCQHTVVTMATWSNLRG